MAASTLRVRAREGIVTRYDLIDQGVKRMVGRKLVPHLDASNGFAWVETGETETLPNIAEFRTSIRDGALWAADEATAREVWPTEWRKHFDASFGTTPRATTAAEATKDAPVEGAEEQV